MQSALEPPATVDRLEERLALLRPGLDHLGLAACVLDRDLRYRHIVSQQFDYSCGAAALATLLKYGRQQAGSRGSRSRLFLLLQRSSHSRRGLLHKPSPTSRSRRVHRFDKRNTCEGRRVDARLCVHLRTQSASCKHNGGYGAS